MEALAKLCATLIAAGVRILASSEKIKKDGRARIEVRREEILQITQACVDAERVLKGEARVLPDGTLLQLTEADSQIILTDDRSGRIEPTLQFRARYELAHNTIIADQLSKDLNIAKTIIFAEEELVRLGKTANEENVGADWFQKWKQYAERVTDDQFQSLWAKVLAGEIIKPGTYSPRTLHLLHNLTAGEAKSIEEMSKFCSITHLYKTKYLESKLSLDFLMDLEEIGIITAVQTEIVQVITSLNDDRFFCNLPHGNRTILMHHSSPKFELTLDCYGLTKIGRELLTLCQTTPDETHLLELAQTIKEYGLKVQLADFEMINPDRGRTKNVVDV